MVIKIYYLFEVEHYTSLVTINNCREENSRL